MEVTILWKEEGRREGLQQGWGKVWSKGWPRASKTESLDPATLLGTVNTWRIALSPRCLESR